MPTATVRANARALPHPTANDCIRHAYHDLESPLRDLARMGAIARSYVSGTEWPPGLTGEWSREIERVFFLIEHVADMADKLEKTYDDGFSQREIHNVVLRRRGARRPCKRGVGFGPPRVLRGIAEGTTDLRLLGPLALCNPCPEATRP